MRLLIFAFSLIATAALAPAEAADPMAADTGAGLDACASARTLARITERFDWAERNTWRRGYRIAAIDNPRLRYAVTYGPSMIAHGHCRAEALMSDGSRRTIIYTISAGMGFASMGAGVDFCIVGLDPWRVHGAACRSLR